MGEFLYERVETVSHGWVGHPVSAGEFLETAAGLQEVEHERLVLVIEAHKDWKLELPLHPCLAIIAGEPDDFQGMLATGAPARHALLAHYSRYLSEKHPTVQ